MFLECPRPLWAWAVERAEGYVAAELAREFGADDVEAMGADGDEDGVQMTSNEMDDADDQMVPPLWQLNDVDEDVPTSHQR